MRALGHGQHRRRHARRLPRLRRRRSADRLRRQAPRQSQRQHRALVGRHRHVARSSGLRLQGRVTDQFSRPPITPTGIESVNDGPNPIVAAISSPRAGRTFLQYELIPLRGLILSAKGVEASSSHRWDVDGPGTFARSGTGTIIDLQPPNGGWPAGSYTATLTKPGSTERRGHRPGDVHGGHRRRQRRRPEDGRRRMPRRRRQRPDERRRRPGQRRDPERRRPAAVHRGELVHGDRGRQSRSRCPPARAAVRSRPTCACRAGTSRRCSPRPSGSPGSPTRTISTNNDFRNTGWTSRTASARRSSTGRSWCSTWRPQHPQPRGLDHGQGQLGPADLELRGVRPVFIQG